MCAKQIIIQPKCHNVTNIWQNVFSKVFSDRNAAEFQWNYDDDGSHYDFNWIEEDQSKTVTDVIIKNGDLEAAALNIDNIMLFCH